MFPRASLPYPPRHADRATLRSAVLIRVLFGFGIALSPLGDYLSVRESGGETRVSLMLRGAVLAALLVSMLLSARVQAANWRTVLLALVALAASSAACLAGEMTSVEYGQQVVFLLKVFSFFVYLAALALLDERQLAWVERWVGLALALYAVAILAGAALSIDIFRSYQGD